MISKNAWHPDTCNCLLEVTTDTDKPDEVIAELKAACLNHVSLPLGFDSGKILLRENIVKNITEGTIRDAYPEITWDEHFKTLHPITQEVLTTLQLTGHFNPPIYKPGLKYEYQHNEDRMLIVNLAALGLEEKHALELQPKIADTVILFVPNENKTVQ